MIAEDPKAQSGADSKAEWTYKSAVLVFCIALNYIGSVIAFDNSYRFLFLDMIGTFIAAVVFGPVFAVTTALLTNILTSITTPNLAHFAFANAAGGLWWAYAAQRGWLAVLRPQKAAPTGAWRRIRSSLQLIVVGGGGACVAVSVVAVFLKSFVFGHETATYGDYLFAAFAGPAWFRALAADLVLSFPDKTLVAMTGFIVVQSYLRFTNCQLCEIPSTDRRRLAAANRRDITLLALTLVVFLAVLAWRHFQLFPGEGHASAHWTVGLLALALLAAVLSPCFTTRSIRHEALRDLFETQAKHPASNPDYWFLGTLGVGLVFIAMLYWGAFAWLGQTPWAYYASKSWPITPSWTAIIAIIGLAAAQVFIARSNERRATELKMQDIAAVHEEAKNALDLLGQELHRALSGSLQTAQELETGWEENPAIVKQIRNIVAEMQHEPGNWLAQAVREGRPFTGAELAACQGAIEFVKARIKEQCRDIPTMFDFTPQTLPVDQAARQVEDYVKTHFASLESYPYVDLDVQVDQGVRTMSDMEVSLIPGQLRSVLRNLVANSVQAIGRLYRLSAEAQFRRKIVVNIAFDRDLAISVIDEGGGFQPEIVGNIYVTGVTSSRKRVGGGARTGEGTMLIKFFVGLMGATIVADNVTSVDGRVGASTKILFPARPSANAAR